MLISPTTNIYVLEAATRTRYIGKMSHGNEEAMQPILFAKYMCNVVNPTI
jgi:hypothetical protein